MRRINRTSSAGRVERGAVLLISMIFLVILTLTVISALKVSTLNTQMVGNTQAEQEANAAAQQAIEATISTDFTQNPAGVANAAIPVNIDNSGRTGATYNVNVPAPVCIGVKPLKSDDLDISSAQDQPCFGSGQSQNTGMVGGSANGGNSLCSSSNWEVSATPTLPINGTAGTTTRQGIAVRVAVGADC